MASIVSKEAKKKKKLPRGVWSPLGVSYTTHGAPDLGLGEDAKIHDPKKSKKKPRRVAGNNAESRQKLEALMELFRSTKSSLQAVNLFNRGPNILEGNNGKSSKLLPSVQEVASPDSTPRGGLDGDKKEYRPHHYTTAQRIAMLGSPAGERKQRERKNHTKEKYKNVNHLNESRTSHLIRWRDAFEESRDSKDRSLIQDLVSRAEDRERVYENAALLNTAVLLAASGTRPYNQPPTRAGSKSAQISIW